MNTVGVYESFWNRISFIREKLLFDLAEHRGHLLVLWLQTGATQYTRLFPMRAKNSRHHTSGCWREEATDAIKAQ